MRTMTDMTPTPTPTPWPVVEPGPYVFIRTDADGVAHPFEAYEHYILCPSCIAFQSARDAEEVIRELWRRSHHPLDYSDSAYRKKIDHLVAIDLRHADKAGIPLTDVDRAQYRVVFAREFMAVIRTQTCYQAVIDALPPARHSYIIVCMR